MYKLMKIKKLKNYGIPSYILNIWEKHYFLYLLPVQEEAVKEYGVLNCNGSDEIAALSSKARNDRSGNREIHPHPALSPQGRGRRRIHPYLTPPLKGEEMWE